LLAADAPPVNTALDDPPTGSTLPDLINHFAPTFQHAPYDDLDAFVQQAVSHFPIIPDDWLNIDFSHATIPASSEPFHREPTDDLAATHRRSYSFSYLYDFTSKTGLVSSFKCATLQQRQEIVSAFHQSYLENRHADFLEATPLVSTPSGDTPDMVPTDHGLFSWSSWLQNPIVIKLQQVVVLIKNVVTVKPNNSTVTLTWSPALEQQCLLFFSPSRFAKFIELYWSVWHPSVNFLHRPAFDPATSKSVLLAAMALIGEFFRPFL
jgi:hypothetical protein